MPSACLHRYQAQIWYTSMHIDATPTHIKSYFKKINRKAKTLYGKEKMVTQQKQMKTKLKG